MSNLDLSADIIDVRDIIERIEEIQNIEEKQEYKEAKDELNNLLAIMKELASVGGGDEQWQGDWYPITLVADSYFTDYARELLEDCGDISKDLPHYIVIDWQATARNIRVDYTPVTIDGATYWTR